MPPVKSLKDSSSDFGDRMSVGTDRAAPGAPAQRSKAAAVAAAVKGGSLKLLNFVSGKSGHGQKKVAEAIGNDWRDFRDFKGELALPNFGRIDDSENEPPAPTYRYKPKPPAHPKPKPPAYPKYVTMPKSEASRQPSEGLRITTALRETAPVRRLLIEGPNNENDGASREDSGRWSITPAVEEKIKEFKALYVEGWTSASPFRESFMEKELPRLAREEVVKENEEALGIGDEAEDKVHREFDALEERLAGLSQSAGEINFDEIEALDTVEEHVESKKS